MIRARVVPAPTGAYNPHPAQRPTAERAARKCIGKKTPEDESLAPRIDPLLHTGNVIYVYRGGASCALLLRNTPAREITASIKIGSSDDDGDGERLSPRTRSLQRDTREHYLAATRGRSVRARARYLSTRTYTILTFSVHPSATMISRGIACEISSATFPRSAGGTHRCPCFLVRLPSRVSLALR